MSDFVVPGVPNANGGGPGAPGSGDPSRGPGAGAVLRRSRRPGKPGATSSASASTVSTTPSTTTPSATCSAWRLWPPPPNFIADEKALGFDTIAAAFGMTDAQYEQYFNSADALAEQAFADRGARARAS